MEELKFEDICMWGDGNLSIIAQKLKHSPINLRWMFFLIYMCKITETFELIV